MRIEAIAVGKLEAAVDMPELRADGGGAGLSAIDVQPHSVAAADLADPPGGSMALLDVVPMVATV
jgi:hypothetical protein